MYFIFSKYRNKKANLQSDEWHVDETYIKVKEQKHFLWIRFDSETRVVIAFCLSSVRDSNTALALFEKSHNITDASPLTIITDSLDALITCLFCLLIPN